jgi:hypothetical protein
MEDGDEGAFLEYCIGKKAERIARIKKNKKNKKIGLNGISKHESFDLQDLCPGYALGGGLKYKR